MRATSLSSSWPSHISLGTPVSRGQIFEVESWDPPSDIAPACLARWGRLSLLNLTPCLSDLDCGRGSTCAGATTAAVETVSKPITTPSSPSFLTSSSRRYWNVPPPSCVAFFFIPLDCNNIGPYFPAGDGRGGEREGSLNGISLSAAVDRRGRGGGGKDSSVRGDLGLGEYYCIPAFPPKRIHKLASSTYAEIYLLFFSLGQVNFMLGGCRWPGEFRKMYGQ